MERIAQTALHVNNPCFGLEHDRTKPECKRCVLFHLCGKILGDRVALDHLEFELTPSGLYADDNATEIGNLTINRSNVEDLFRRCYYTVFGSRWPESSNLGKDWTKIVENARTAKVSLNTFIATVMAAWKMTHPATPFYVNNLTAESSVAKVDRYSRMLKERYGHDGIDSLGMFTESETPRIEEQMLLSECLTGKWIIGWKMSRDGPAVQSLYRHHELALDPHWLAVEPTYIDTVLRPYLSMESTVNESAAIKAHRERVLSTHSMLKKRKTLARTIFSARSQIMPAALKTVLKGVGHLPENFTHPNVVVKDTIKFWNVLGLAVTHWECLKALRAEPNRLWR
jgi:hypothetical protein